MAAGSMDDLADRHSEAVSSAFLYTREAHPAEHHRHHQSMEDKRANARAFRDQFAVRRPILLDDLEGSAHRAYGILPNMTWIIAPGGLVLYKAAWTNAADIDEALRSSLAGLDRRREGAMPYYSERLAWRVRDDAAFRTGLERNGPQAVTDFYGDS